MSPARKKTKAAKPKASKAPARKKTAKKAASKPSAAKATKRKSTKAKAAKPKKAKTTKARRESAAADDAKLPAAAPASEPAPPVAKAPSRRSRKKPAPAPATEALPQRTPLTAEGRSRLGAKWECFSCGAKFYDLNRPEPLCPKCGANQLDRPKLVPKAKPPPPAPSRSTRAMAPLLEDEEDAMVVENDDIDLGVAGVDEAVGDFIDTGEADDDSIDEDDEDL